MSPIPSINAALNIYLNNVRKWRNRIYFAEELVLGVYTSSTEGPLLDANILMLLIHVYYILINIVMVEILYFVSTDTILIWLCDV
jgi:hypothetical protein